MGMAVGVTRPTENTDMKHHEQDTRFPAWPVRADRLCIHHCCPDCGDRWSHELVGGDCHLTLCWLCERERDPRVRG